MLRNLIAIPAILLAFFVLHAMGVHTSVALFIIAVLTIIYLIISSFVYAKKQKELNKVVVKKKEEEWFDILEEKE